MRMNAGFAVSVPCSVFSLVVLRLLYTEHCFRICVHPRLPSPAFICGWPRRRLPSFDQKNVQIGQGTPSVATPMRPSWAERLAAITMLPIAERLSDASVGSKEAAALAHAAAAAPVPAAA